MSGGTINSGRAQLLVKTTSLVDDSAVARLIRLVEEAQVNRSPTEMLIDEIAKLYTPVVVLAAICMCTFPWIISAKTGREWTKIGLITIVIACPCALIISTPVTYVAGIAAAAQKGIVVKGGAHFEVSKSGQLQLQTMTHALNSTKPSSHQCHFNSFPFRLTTNRLLQG